MNSAHRIGRIIAGASLVGILGVAGLPLVPAYADQTITYVSAGGDAGASGSLNAAPQYSVGGAPFDVTPGTAVSIKIADASGRSVNGKLTFTDARSLGNQLGPAIDICGGSIANVTVPDGAAAGFVTIPTIGNDASKSTPGLLCGAPNAATTGTVTVTSSGGSSRAMNLSAARPTTHPTQIIRFGASAEQGARHAAPRSPRGLRTL